MNTPDEIAALFQPLKIRGVTLSNRMGMAPMTRSCCPGGHPGPRNVEYYGKRAEGEAGLILTEAIGLDHPVSIGDTGLGETDLPLFDGPDAVSAWRKVVDRVHVAGTPIFPQLWHQGAMRLPGSQPNPELPAFSPSGYYGDPEKASEYYKEMARKLAVQGPIPKDAEIVEVIESFGRAAEQAVEAGFDGLALHGGHGYLLDQFLWGETNRRTDRWGGNLKERTRFAVEVIRRVRQVIGEDRPLVFRFSQWKQQDFLTRLADTPDELEQVLGPLADAGVDMFDASTRYFNTPAFSGSDLTLAGWAKKLTGKLSSAVGGVGFNKGMYDTWDPVSNTHKEGAEGFDNLDLVLKRFNAGEFDVILIGRALLGDPTWIAKARRGEAFPPFDFRALDILV